MHDKCLPLLWTRRGKMHLRDVCTTNVHPTLLDLEFKIEDFTSILIIKYILHTLPSV